MSLRRSKRHIIRNNAAKGKAGERRVRDKYKRAGYRIKRTGRGHDFKATRTNRLTGKREIRYVEVKTGRAKLSPLQKRKKQSLGKNYVVERGDQPFLFDLAPKGRSKKPATLGLFGEDMTQQTAKLLVGLKPATPSRFDPKAMGLKPATPGWLDLAPKGRSKKSPGSGLFDPKAMGLKPATPSWLDLAPKGRSKKSPGSGLFGSTSKGRRSRTPKWKI